MKTNNADFEAKVENNVWDDNLDEVIDFIKEATNPSADWDYLRNMNCKYIDIRIDMRGGDFILLDRNGTRVSLDMIKAQKQWTVLP